MKVTKDNIFELAKEGDVEVLDHKDVAVLEDNDGETPLHILADQGKVKVKDLKKLFPWYQYKRGTKIDEDLITELINTPNSLRFILKEKIRIACPATRFESGYC